MFMTLIPVVLNILFKEGASWFKEYQQGKISMEELRTNLQKVIVENKTKVEVAEQETIRSTYATFWQGARNSRLVRWVWAIVTLSQCFVLVWHQWVIPLIIWVYPETTYPSSGDLIKWAYLLLGFLLGGGGLMLKSSAAQGQNKTV